MYRLAYNNRIYELESYVENDYVYRQWANTGTFYEIKLLEEIRKRNRKGIYVDLGSNVGNHAIYFATQCPCDEIICVDADKIMCDRLRENFKRNNLKEPTIYNYAITGQVGMVTLTEVKDTTCKVISNNGNVPSTTIDALLGNMSGIAVLKMDIEWCEVEAIKQSELFFKNNSPLLAVELVDREIFNSFKSIIEKYGYRTDGRNYAYTPTYIWERTI